MTLQVFGILNTISELSAFIMMCHVAFIATAITMAHDIAANDTAKDVDISHIPPIWLSNTAGGVGPHWIYAVLLLAHTICTIFMVCKNNIKNLFT